MYIFIYIHTYIHTYIYVYIEIYIERGAVVGQQVVGVHHAALVLDELERGEGGLDALPVPPKDLVEAQVLPRVRYVCM